MKTIFISILLLFSNAAFSKVCKITSLNNTNAERSCRAGDIARIHRLTTDAVNRAISDYCNHSKTIAIVPPDKMKMQSQHTPQASCVFRNNKK